MWVAGVSSATEPSTGRSTQNVDPSFGRDRTPSEPPIRSARPRDSESPTPVPSMPACSRPRRSKGTKRRWICSLLSPGPVSVTHRRTCRVRCSPAVGVQTTPTSTRPPGWLYLMALDTRFNSTWVTRWLSARIMIAPSPWSGPSRWTPARSANGPTRPTTSARIRPASTDTGCSDRCGDSTRPTSRTSLMRRRRWSPARRIWSTWPAIGGSSASTSRSCPKPRMAFSGVRSSWLIRERNSVLAWLARSASSLADLSSASRAMRSDTSRLTITTASLRSCSSSMSWAWASIVTHRSSERRTRKRSVDRRSSAVVSATNPWRTPPMSRGCTMSKRHLSTMVRVGCPKTRSNATLVLRMVPSSSAMVITSGEAPMTVESTRSRAARVAVARVSSVMSVATLPTAVGTPSGSRIGNFWASQVLGPSASVTTSSNCAASRPVRTRWSLPRRVGAASGQWSKSLVPMTASASTPSRSANARFTNW